jgi:hypothetical protein
MSPRWPKQRIIAILKLNMANYRSGDQERDHKTNTATKGVGAASARGAGAGLKSSHSGSTTAVGMTGPLASGRAALLLEGGVLRAQVGDGGLLLANVNGGPDEGQSGEAVRQPSGALDRLVAGLLQGNPGLEVVPVQPSGDGDLPPEPFNGSADRPVPLYRVPIPKETLVRFTDPNLFWMFLAGRLGDGGRGDYLGRRNRIVDTGEVTAAVLSRDAEAGRLWVCKAEWTRSLPGPADGRKNRKEPLRVSWLVRETTAPGAGNSESGGPGKDLAWSLYRLQNAFRSVGFRDCRVGISRQGASRIDERRPLLRLGTEYWEGFWPKGALERIQEEISRLYVHRDGRKDDPPRREGVDPSDTIPKPVRGGETRQGPGLSGIPPVVTAAVLETELEQQGLLSLAYRLPASREERVGGYAIRTVYAFLAQGGRSLRWFVDSAYRSGRRFRAFSTVYHALGETERARLDRVLGVRRRAALADEHRLVREGQSDGVGQVNEPWRLAALAAETLVGDYARSTRRRGYAADVESMKILEKYYISPRGNSLREIWEKRRNDPMVEGLLEDGRLSLLRIYGRTVPRAVLVDAAAGTTEQTKRRLAAIFSRRGRRLFLEDIDVLEEAVRRDGFIEWDRLLSAREHLTALARRIQD